MKKYVYVAVFITYWGGGGGRGGYKMAKTPAEIQLTLREIKKVKGGYKYIEKERKRRKNSRLTDLP